MKSKMLLMLLVLFGFSHSWAQGGVGDGGGSDTFEGVMERSSILGHVYKQTKDALIQSGYATGESETTWGENKTITLLRNFSKVEESKCHRISIEVHAAQVGQFEEIVVQNFETRDFGLSADMAACVP